ncbi:hypothetical protein [Nocardioides soli]|uniref:Thiol-disulfide isomerase/thioredoxin n=1 Tax=Nocardioides soli TaxID=1036020 RepID=A0A7W4VSC1_9ACTN|nr:hypothetical protein [Nocardioides soli]MBB3040839.1 thiol-disulfide isomerase/thioredoxin [Nocardioides soli]
MSVTSAALILSWVAIAILGLGYAGLRRQLNEVHADTIFSSAASSAPARSVISVTRTGRPSLILLSTDDCPVCLEIVPAFRRLATSSGLDVDHVILMRSGTGDAGAEVPVVVDAMAFNTLEPGYLPALVLADNDGLVLTIEPVGGIAALESVGKRFHSRIAGVARSVQANVEEHA